MTHAPAFGIIFTKLARKENRSVSIAPISYLAREVVAHVCLGRLLRYEYRSCRATSLQVL